MRRPDLTIDTIRAIATPICRKHGVARADLFGSYARGEQTPTSDIDIVIDEGAVRGLGFFRLQQDLAESLGKRVDLQSLNGCNKTFLSAIEHDRITLYVGQP